MLEEPGGIREGRPGAEEGLQACGAGTNLDTGGRPTPCDARLPAWGSLPACHVPLEPPEAPLLAPCLLGP